MPEGNGKDPLDKLREDLRLLMESHSKNWEEHDRIWGSIQVLKEDADKNRTDIGEVAASVKNLVAAIRDLIDRIPPENLR